MTWNTIATSISDADTSTFITMIFTGIGSNNRFGIIEFNLLSKWGFIITLHTSVSFLLFFSIFIHNRIAAISRDEPILPFACTSLLAFHPDETRRGPEIGQGSAAVREILNRPVKRQLKAVAVAHGKIVDGHKIVLVF